MENQNIESRLRKKFKDLTNYASSSNLTESGRKDEYIEDKEELYLNQGTPITRKLNKSKKSISPKSIQEQINSYKEDLNLRKREIIEAIRTNECPKYHISTTLEGTRCENCLDQQTFINDCPTYRNFVEEALQ